MKKHLHKIFFGIGIACTAAMLGLLLGHIYWGDRFFPETRYFSSPQSHFFAPKVTEFSVALVGDTGAENHVLERVIDDAQESDNDYAFMLYLGDFVTKKTRTGMSWLLHEIRPHLHNMPFYATPGNHDVELSHIVDKSHYRSMMGSTYYWFGYGNVLFVALDSSGKYIEDEQFEWLDNTLAKIRPMFKHCVIYSHKPPIELIPGVVKNHTLKKSDADKLAAIVKKHRVNAMIFGHVHYFAKGTFAGVPIYTIPAAGQGNRVEDKAHGYASITFDKHGIKSVEPHYIDFKGPKRESFEYSTARRLFGYALRDTVSWFLLLAILSFGIGCILYKINHRD